MNAYSDFTVQAFGRHVTIYSGIESYRLRKTRKSSVRIAEILTGHFIDKRFDIIYYKLCIISSHPETKFEAAASVESHAYDITTSFSLSCNISMR
jgi:hypothetical protein